MAAGILSSTLLVVLVVSFGVPQGVYSDPGWQLKAVQQNVAGMSPTANTLVTPDPADLSRDKAEWLFWWPPGAELFVLPLMRVGFSAGSAVRMLAAACVIAGSAGWPLWISAFAIPPWMKLLLSVLLPWTHYAQNNLFLYSAESFVFAAVPWALLAAVCLTERWRRTEPSLAAAILTGLFMGFLYVLKYSALFISAGAVIYVFLLAADIGSPKRGRALKCAALCALACALPVVALTVVNQCLAGSANPMTVGRSMAFRWESLLFAVANPALICASADAPLLYFLFHPTTGLLKNSSQTLLGFAGLPGGLALLALVWGGGRRTFHARAARAVFACSIACILIVWTPSPPGADYEARHLAGASIAVLPLALETACGIWVRSGIIRWTLALAGILYVVLPSVYGFGSALGKTVRQARQASGPSGLYNPLLAGSSVPQARDILVEGFNPGSDIWYVTDPISAMDLPGRTLIRHADFTDIQDLRAEMFRTSRRLRLRMLLPPHFERNGKGPVIRQSFVGAGPWQPCPSDGTVLCWSSWIEPAGPATQASFPDRWRQ